MLEMPACKSSRVFLVLCALNLFALIGLWWLETTLAERQWLVTIIAYVPQHPLGLVTVALLVWALMARDGRGFALNLPALALFAFFFMGVNVPVRALMAGTPEGLPLRVMTYNVLSGKQGVDQVVNALQAESPDVMCVQEAPRLEVRQRLERAFPKFSSAQEYELIVLSTFPIRKRVVHRIPVTRRTVLETVLDVNGRAVHVINVHFNTLDIQGLVSPDLTAIERFRLNSRGRWFVTDIVLNIVNNTRDPVIVCGDFNLPPRGALYNALDARLTDAFRVAGWGSGFTYSATLPVIRIDYVWTTDQWRATRAFVPVASASDHRAFVADLVLKP
jgi:endonuclease/exonuclease/phosphatase (EEP) superfamily protein YafD